jgi:Tudor domain
VAVRFIDYGDLTMMNVADLQPLWPQFRQLAYQAITARLANIRPAEGDWRPEDTVWFSNRVADKPFVSLIKKAGLNLDVGPEPVVELELVLVDTSLPDLDRYIDQELIEAGRAVPLTASEASDN